MDYDAVLAQVLELLQREQRVAYRILKRRLQLDDETLEDLKDDLIYAKKLAVDEDGRVLVWRSGTSSAPPTASPVPLPAAPDVSPTQGEAAAVAPPTPAAERRQLTVLFCDLVDSTQLSSQLDPEEYREVVRAYQRVCAEIIQRYDGYIAQYLGDGLLVYFGYPQSHEDAAQRAVSTSLGLLDALQDLNLRLEQAPGIRLAARVGLHTGVVVVGEIGEGPRQEQLALGETPNIAARLQGLAAPNTVAISAATYRLVQGYFVVQDLAAQTLRGVAEPVHVYRVLQASAARGRLDVAATRGLTPLVGRESEVTLLLERWAQAKSGQGQVLLLTGDAGIGKSRLVQVLKDHVANEPHVRWECRSAEYYQNTVLFPLTDFFHRLLQFQAEDTSDEKVEKLAQTLSKYRLPFEESVQLFATLLSLPLPEEHSLPLNLSPQRQRQKTLETLIAILLELAERQPVLLILEDLHWTDPTTLEWLHLLIDQTPTASVLVLLTCRPHFQPAWHHRSYLTEITVNRLSPTQVEQIVTRMTEGKPFPPEVLQQIIAKTDGVPLFIEEMTKAILESGHLKETDGHYVLTGSLSTFVIPATLQDSLMARLDRLVTAKAVAQYAAVIGRQFSYALLQAVSQVDEAILQHELGRLVEAEMIYQRGLPPQATYTFKHALIQDAAYQSLLRSTRQQYHQRIAQALEAQFPETVATQPELVAQHYTVAGCAEQAVIYWQRAGQRANQRSAHAEAMAYLGTGLELLKSLPDTPERAQQELDLQVALGPALMAAKGFAAPEVLHAYARARELCQQVGETTEIFPVLWGLWRFYFVRAEHQTARELAEQCLNLAQRVQDPALLLVAHHAVGGTACFLGEVALARAHLEQGLALYDPQAHRTLAFRYGHDFKIWCLAYVAWPLWLLGYPDQALTRSNEAITLAQELSHPISLAAALAYAAWLHHSRREAAAAQECAETAIMLSSEKGFVQYMAIGRPLRGWALAMQEQGEEGIAQLHQGLAAVRAVGSGLDWPRFLLLLAEAYGSMRQPEAGLSAVTEALATVHKTEERWWEAELHRLQGELLALSAEKPPEAESCFHQALTVARHQQAKSLELRAAMSLARLWQQQGKRQEAHDLLAPVYNWFTEGFDTADLQDAKALLHELEDGR